MSFTYDGRRSGESTCHSVWWKCYLPVLPCPDEDVIGTRLGAVQRLHDWKLRVCTLESQIFYWKYSLGDSCGGLAHSLGRHLQIWGMMTDFPSLIATFSKNTSGFRMMDTRKAGWWEINNIDAIINHKWYFEFEPGCTPYHAAGDYFGRLTTSATEIWSRFSAILIYLSIFFRQL